MIELLILASITVVVLAVLLAVQARGINAERAEWREERRFLVDRAIARHVGEVVALEREDARKDGGLAEAERETLRAMRPLVEGLT